MIETRETDRALIGAFGILSKDSLNCHIKGGWIEKDGVPVDIPRIPNLTLPDDEPNVYVYVNMTADEIQLNTTGWPKGCKRLYRLTTADGIISDKADNRAAIRFSHHSCFATHDSWLKDATINADLGWTDFDVSSVISIPAWAKGVLLEIHVKETGTIVGDDSHVILRKPGVSAQSQWKLVPASAISGRFAVRTVPIEFGADRKTIQYRADVETSLILKVGLAGWVPGSV